MALISLWMSWAFDKECPFATHQPQLAQFDVKSCKIAKFAPKKGKFSSKMPGQPSFRPGYLHACLVIAPTYVCARTIRGDYYVVPPHYIAHTSLCVLLY